MAKRRRRKYTLATCIALVLILGSVAYYWHSNKAYAAVVTWDGGGVTNNWSEDANWSGDVEPGASDVATFSSTSTKDVTIDAAINVQGIDINSGYTGTMTQAAGVTVTVGTGDFDISDGTFTGGDSAITISDSFTVSGGTFTSTSGTMSIVNTFTVSSGTFNDGGGTVEASGTSNITWNVVTSETFNNLTFNKNGTTVTISSGDTFVVNGTLTLTNGSVNTGTLDAQGDISQAATFDGGTAIIDLGNDAVAQTYTFNGGTAPTIRLNSAADASDSLSFAAATTVTHLNMTSAFSGAIPVSNPSDFEMRFTTWTQDAGTYDASAQSSWFFSDFNLASGATFTAPALVTSTASNHSWDVPTSQTFEDFTINNGGANMFIANGDTLVVNGTTTLTNGTWALSGSTGFLDAKGDVVQASTFDGGDATINFADDTVAQTYTINGGSGPVIQFDDPDDANDLVTYASNPTTMYGFTTTSGFSGTIPISNASDFSLVIRNWVQGGGTYDASAQTAWTIQNFDTTGGTFLAPALVTSTALNDIWDVNTSQTFNDFTYNAAASLRIPDGDTLEVDGTLTLTNGGLDAVGSTGRILANGDINQASTFDGGDGFIDFGNDVVAQTWTVSGGVTPKMRFDDPDDASDEVVFNAAATVTSMTTTAGFTGSIPLTNSGDFTLVWSDWTQAGGDYDATGQTNWTFSGNFDRTGGTLTLPTNVLGTANSHTWDFDTSQTFNNVTFNNSGFAFNIATADTWIVLGTLTLTNGAINLAGATGNIEAWSSISQASTWDGGTGVIDFADDAEAQTWTVDGASTNVMRFDDPDDASDLVDINIATSIQGVTITSGFSGAVPIDNAGDVTLSVVNWTQDAGTYDASAQTGWNLYNFTRTAGTFTAPVTITSYSTGNPVWDFPTSQTFNNVTLNRTNGTQFISSGDTLTLTGDLTLGNGLLSTGNVDVEGDVTVQSTFDGGTAPLTFTGSATQSFDLTGATGLYDGDISVNKAGGQVNLASDLIMNTNSQDLTIIEGVFDLVGHALTVSGVSGTFTVQDGGTFELFGGETITLNASNPTLSSGSTVRYTGDGDAASDTYTVTTLEDVYHHLTINSTDGATDTFQLDAAIDINGNFTNTAGTFDVSASDFAMTVAGNWSNSGTFTAQSGTVTLDGSAQTISGSTTFNNFTKTVAAADSLTFPAGATQTFTGTMTLQGASTTDRLSLESSTPGVKALIDPQSTRTVSYLDVQDNDNNNATAITCGTGCFDSGNNENWEFPGIQVSTISGDTTEAGVTATFTVVLGSAPTDDVTVTLDSDDTTEGTVDQTTLTFTTLNWSTPQTVTVTGVNDDVDDGDIGYNIVIDPATSTDLVYDGVDPSDVVATNIDNDTSGVTVSAISGNTTEAGGTATFTVVLDSEPTGDVQVVSVTNDATEGTVTGGATLTFTNLNWDTPQTVTVTGQDDALNDGDIAYSILVSTNDTNTVDPLYDAVDPADVSVTNTDDENPGFLVSAISNNTSETGNSGTFTVVLSTQPSDDVVVDLDSSDTTEGTVDLTTLTFTNLNWDTPQTVTVTGQDDDIDDGNVAYTIVLDPATSLDADYNGVDPDDVSVSNTDNDTAGVTVSAISGNTSETGTTATFTVVLASEPTGDVEIDSVTDDATEGTVTGGATLTFTNLNWDTPQTVTVTGQDDALSDGNIGYNIVVTVDAANTADAVYDAINPNDVAVTNLDDDVVGVTVSAISANTTEPGGTATFTVVLDSQPTGDVEIDSVTDDATEGTVTGGATLTFTNLNWDTPQTVTVTGQDDDVDDGNIAYNIVVTVDAANTADPDYDAIDPDDVAVTNTDNDTAGVTVSTISGNTTELGGTATFTVVLTSEPTGDVEIDSVTDDATEGTVTGGATLTFTNLNWDTPQTVTVTGQDDFIADGNIAYSIVVTVDAANTTDASYDAINPNDVSVTNTDNDTAGVTVSAISGPTTEAGGTATFTVVLNSLPAGDVEIDSVSSDLTEGIVTGGATLTFTTLNWDTPQTVTVTGQDDLVNDGNIGYTIFVTVDAANTNDDDYDAINPDDVSVSNTDNDAAGVIVTESGGTTSVAEAGTTSDTYEIVLESQPTDDVVIDITSDADTTVLPIQITFTNADWDTPQTITVTAVDDSIDETDPHTSTISHVATSLDPLYDGIAIDDVLASVSDDDSSSITVSAISGDTTEAGGTATFTVVLETQPSDDVVITLDSNNAAEGTVDQTTLTFTTVNWDTPQTVTVTGQDDAVDDGDISYVIVLDAATSTDVLYSGVNPADVDVVNLDNDTASSGGGGEDTRPTQRPEAPPSNYSILIEDGARVTNDTSVSVLLYAESADEYELSNSSNFSGNSWVSFDEPEQEVGWTLDVISGLATVYVRFRNSDGAMSSTVSDSIEVVLPEEQPGPEEEQPGEEEEPGEDEGAAPATQSPDGQSLPADISRFVRTYDSPTVYAEFQDGTLRAVPDLQTFLTYSNGCQDVTYVDSNAVVSTEIGAPISLNAGVVLAKFPEHPEVYTVEIDSSDPRKRVLQHLVSEEVAAANFGPSWADYVVEIQSLDDFYRIGEPIDGLMVDPESRSLLRARAALNNSVSYSLSIEGEAGVRLPASHAAVVKSVREGVMLYSFEDGTDADFNDVVLEVDTTNCLTFDIKALPLDARQHHKVWMTIYWDGKPKKDILLLEDATLKVNTLSVVDVFNDAQIGVSSVADIGDFTPAKLYTGMRKSR